KTLAHIHKVRLETADDAPRRSRNAARERELGLIAKDERYWINTYAAIFESRAEEESEELEDEEATDIVTASGLVPFILYPFQDYWVTWHRRALRTRGGKGDTITIKSRDMGVTNTAVSTMAYRW